MFVVEGGYKISGGGGTLHPSTAHLHEESELVSHSNLILLDNFVQHNNTIYILFPNHFPEVLTCVWQRSLN